MAYRVKITFSDGGEDELLDEVFETEEAATDAGLEWLSDFSAGADTLELMGQSYTDPDCVDFEVFEE